MTPSLDQEVQRRLAHHAALWLFLDYDGTLAEFAPTPDHILPDRELIELIRRLAEIPSVRLTILSGRRLAHIRTLLPVPGIILAGTYGLEIDHPQDGLVMRLDAAIIRPALDELEGRWAEIIRGKPGFYLEDKGLALALHARFAEDALAAQALEQAQLSLTSFRSRPELFRILDGYKFLEVGPAQAGKGSAVDYLLDRYAWPEAQVIYIGDDDKDEEAFVAVRARGGLTVLVAAAPRSTHAQFRLDSPVQTRQWLSHLVDILR